MELYHASKEIVKYPEIRKAKYTKDFSWGFYCTNNMEQAVRWANRGTGTPVINYYDYRGIIRMCEQVAAFGNTLILYSA